MVRSVRLVRIGIWWPSGLRRMMNRSRDGAGRSDLLVGGRALPGDSQLDLLLLELVAVLAAVRGLEVHGGFFDRDAGPAALVVGQYVELRGDDHGDHLG